MSREFVFFGVLAMFLPTPAAALAEYVMTGGVSTWVPLWSGLVGIGVWLISGVFVYRRQIAAAFLRRVGTMRRQISARRKRPSRAVHHRIMPLPVINVPRQSTPAPAEWLEWRHREVVTLRDAAFLVRGLVPVDGKLPLSVASELGELRQATQNGEIRLLPDKSLPDLFAASPLDAAMIESAQRVAKSVDQPTVFSLWPDSSRHVTTQSLFAYAEKFPARYPKVAEWSWML